MTLNEDEEQLIQDMVHEKEGDGEVNTVADENDQQILQYTNNSAGETVEQQQIFQEFMANNVNENYQADGDIVDKNDGKEEDDLTDYFEHVKYGCLDEEYEIIK